MRMLSCNADPKNLIKEKNLDAILAKYDEEKAKRMEFSNKAGGVARFSGSSLCLTLKSWQIISCPSPRKFLWAMNLPRSERVGRWSSAGILQAHCTLAYECPQRAGGWGRIERAPLFTAGRGEQSRLATPRTSSDTPRIIRQCSKTHRGRRIAVNKELSSETRTLDVAEVEFDLSRY